MRTIITGSFALLLVGALMAAPLDLTQLQNQPVPSAPTTSSDAVNSGGVRVVVVVGKTNVQAEPLTIRVEMKNTLDRVVRLYTSTSHWTWRFAPADGNGYWTIQQQFAEDRVISVAIQPGKTLGTGFTTHSTRGQEYVFRWVGEGKKPIQPGNSLPVGRYRLTVEMDLSTFSRPTTQPEPWEGKLTTAPVVFEVVSEKPATASQPANDILTVAQFNRIVTFMLARGDRQTYCQMYNDNPHAALGGANLYLNPDVGQRNINCDPKKSGFDELVIRTETMDYYHIKLDAKRSALSYSVRTDENLDDLRTLLPAILADLERKEKQPAAAGNR